MGWPRKVDVPFKEFKELCYVCAHRRFTDKFKYLEPIVDLFSPRSPIRRHPPPRTEIPEFLIAEEEIKTKVEVHPPTQETALATSYRTHHFVESEGTGYEHIPLVLNTLQELKQENEVIRTRLDKHMRLSKNKLKRIIRLKGSFMLYYPDCHPLLKP